MHTKATLRKKERKKEEGLKLYKKKINKREEREKSMLQQVKVWRGGGCLSVGVV